MVEQNLVQLIKSMNQMASLYEELLELTKSQTEAILERQTERLKDIIHKQQKLILDVTGLEKTRMEASNVLASHFSVPVKELNLSKLESMIPKEVYALLSPSAKRIEEASKELAQLNEKHRKLLESSIEFVNFSINLLTSSNFEAGYRSDGQESDERLAGVSKIFDYKS